MPHRSIGTAAAFAIALGLAACQDLAVENTQNPDRNRALQLPPDVEALGGSQFLVFFNRLTNRTAVYNPVPTMADEMTATYANDGSLEISSEPRVEFNNDAAAEVAGMSIFPYREFNSMVASANDVLNVIDEGLVILTPEDGLEGDLTDNTFRTRTFAKFIQALGQGYLSLYFDSAFVVSAEQQSQISRGDLQVADLELLPYQEVRDSAIAHMNEAIALMEDPNDFVLPQALYFRTRDVDDELLAQIAHTYIARFLVYGARTPEERAALDWDLVLTHLNQAITEDFVLPLAPNVLTAGYLFRISNAGSFSARADYKMVGPADTSGAYQAWIAKPLDQRERFDIVTPDRRITDATGPTSTGKYFRYRANDVFNVSRGIYHFSAYQWRRNTSSSSGQIIWLSKAEVDLMKAEAYYFAGDRQQAADLINISRVGNGELPPITAAGDTSVGCVPRRTDGTCGDLYDAIIYERTIEAAGQDALRTYFDSRGLGRLPEGTIIHLPLSIEELVALSKPVYTYGGVGRPGSVPKCTSPTLTCHPDHP